MPVLSVSNIRVIEGNSSFEYAEIRVSLDAPATAPATFYYYTQDRTAESRPDYNGSTNTVVIPTGESFVDVRIPIYGDTAIEGDESFEFVLLPSPGTSVPEGAAAMVSTVTIADNDDATPDSPAATLGPGRLIFGPATEPGPLPTLTAHDVTVIEGDSSFKYAYFLVTLDRPATAEIRLDYHFQDGSASGASEDYDTTFRTLTIPAGRQSSWIRTPVRADSDIESDEDFQLVLTNVSNAVFAGGGEALTATATILDDDSGPISGPAGLGDPGTPVQGPDKVDTLPTLRFNDVTVIEGDSSFKYAYVPYTLDAPASTQLRVDYYTQSGSASDTEDDFRGTWNTLTIPAGTESGTLRFIVYGDTAIEGDENFSVVFTNLQNGQFEGGTAVMQAEVTILDNDSGPLSGPAGIGDPAAQLPTPVSTSSDIPVLQISDVSVYEGDGSFAYANFLITLDRPAPTKITARYVFDDGTASKALRDFDSSSGTLTIDAGSHSTYLRVAVRGDTQIEANEHFNLVLTELQNATFYGNGPALVARGTIIEDDAGAPTLEAGIGDVARPILGPPVSPDGIVLDAVSTSVTEGDSSYAYAYVYVLLSEPATSEVEVDWRTVENAGAEGGSDYVTASGTLRIPAGSSSSYVRLQVYGDNAIEGDESFQVEFSSPTGAVLAGGQATLTAEVRIADNDSSGTPATGPDFTFGTPANNGPNYLLGTAGKDGLRGFGGNDTIVGLAGDDNLVGDGGNDTLLGGDGADRLVGGAGNDWLTGGAHSDGFVLTMGMGRDTVTDFQHGIDHLDFNSLTLAQQAAVTFSQAGGTVTVRLGDGSTMMLGNVPVINGNGAHNNLPGTVNDDFIQGFGGNDILNGGAGNDMLVGHAGFDTLNGGNGNDTLDGGDGNDLLNGENGNDLHRAGGGDNVVFAGAGNDYVSAFGGNDEIYGGLGNDALFAGAGNDSVGGAGGNDQIGGGAGDDELWGGAGSDSIYGGAGSDTIGAGSENDEVGGGAGNDTVWAGSGNDTVYGNDGHDELSTGTGLDLVYSGTGNDTIYAGNGNDTLGGVGGNDELWAGGGDDVAYGWTGNDLLLGLAGNDDLWGGNGADTLNGGTGNDTLRGGADADTLVFSAGADRALGFGGGDRVDLSGVAAITSFADLQANHLTGGAEAVISDGLGNSLTLVGVGVGTLDAGDFIF